LRRNTYPIKKGGFPWAIMYLVDSGGRSNKLVREGWPDKSEKYIVQIIASELNITQDPIKGDHQNYNGFRQNYYLGVVDRDSGVVTPWTPSQEDIFANDWELLN